MIAEEQAKIVLEARTTVSGVRLSKSRVTIFPEEPPVVAKPDELPRRYNLVPLLTFFAYYKLHALEGCQEAFQARAGGQKWVIQLYDLIKNCGKRETSWLEMVFGSHRTAPHICSVHRVITAFKDGREHVVALAATAPRPEQIELSLDGMRAESERELQEFLRRLSSSAGIETSPPSAKHDARRAKTHSRIDAEGYVERYRLPEWLQGNASLWFPKFNLAHNDFERECLKQLIATHKLDVKWLGIGMEYGVPVLPGLLRRLVGSVSECEITVSIAMLDPDWEYLEHLRPDWPGGVRKSYDRLMALVTLYREQQRTLKKRKVSIGVRTYEYIPNWHGLAINDSQFYVGSCSWEETVPGSGEVILTEAINPYIALSPESGGFEAWLAVTFRTWFNYAFHWSDNSRTGKQAVARGRR
jgi:hypothetical protein